MRNLIFIAPPAAGKGTVSGILKEKYHVPSISAGDLLRAVRSEDSDRAREIIAKQDAGLLVDDSIVLELLGERISKEDCNNGFIMDGFPRSLSQAEAYEKLLEKLHKDLGIVIYLEVEKELARKRTFGRISCPTCGAVFNDLFPESMPKVTNTCDKCGSALVRRTDDNEETFNHRYDTYIEKTLPLLDYYEKKGILYRVNSNNGSDEAVKDIEKILN